MKRLLSDCDISARYRSELCKNSKIYRIGGDEFVIILAGEDYKNRQMLYQALRSQFIDSYDETREPCNRYSASLGLAEYQSTDLGLSDIMKRADEAMYADKAAFKATYGSYR